MIIFIPIKKNSQRVPNKNFRNFGGAPLYKHTLYKLRNEVVYVDTDSDDLINDISKDSNLKNVIAFKRQGSLIGDSVSVCDLIRSFIISNNISNEYICQMHVTSPFINLDIINDAYMKIDDGYNSVASCNKIKARLWRNESYGYCPVNHNPMRLEQTQDLPDYYVENSAFYIFNSDIFLKNKLRVGDNPYFYEIGFPYNLDIDTECDWDMCIDINNFLRKNEATRE